jgi:soluble lytic murein transglycosylase
VSILWAALVVALGCVTHTHGTDHTTASLLPDLSSLPDPGQPLPQPAEPPPFGYFLTGPFAPARAAFEAERWAEAARLFEATLKTPDPDRTLEMQHGARLLMGLAQSRAGALADAAVTLQALADDNGLLADYALFSAAEAALADDNPTAALKIARRIDKGCVMGVPALLMLARAHIAQSAHTDAISTLEEARARAPLSTPEGRQATLLLGQSLAALNKLEPAGEAFLSIIKATPGRPEAKDARKALDALLPKLPPDAQARLTPPKVPPPPPDPLADAKALYDRHRSEDAIAAFDKLRKQHTLKKDPKTWCEATYLIGKSYSKLRTHAKAAPFYDEVIEHCHAIGGDLHINALYNGAKAHWNAGTLPRAADAFASIPSLYPKSSLADDALLYLAQVQSEQGKTEKARETLRQQISQYPKGDMLKEAHWLIYSASYRNGQYADALAYINDNMAQHGEDDLYTRGRMAYFRARCLEHLKQPAEATAAYQQLISDHPLGFYSLMAFGRLSHLDQPAALRLALTVRPHATPPAPLPFGDASPLATDPAFLRAILLARLGLWPWSDAEWDRVKPPNDDLKALLPWYRVALLDASQRYTISHKRAEALLKEPIHAYPDARSQSLWAMAYPRPFLPRVWEQANLQGLPPHLVYAIMREESSFNPTIESWANARGLMQLMLPTAQSQAAELKDPKPSADDLFKPATSIRLGAAYLAKLGGLFNNQLPFIVAGYNGGQGNVGKWLDKRGHQPLDLWIEDIPYGQTRDYTKRVLTTLWRYHFLYHPHPASLSLFDPATPSKAAANR